MADTVIEQVPQYNLTYTDDGIQERLQLVVQLPGLASAKEFQVTVKPNLFTLRAAGRYRLSLPLNPPVDEKPELLRFVKKKAVLKAELKVLSAADSLLRAAPSPTAHESSQSFSEDGNGGVHQGRMNGIAATGDSSAYSQHPSTAAPFDAQEHTDALKEIWGQLLAQQRLNGQLAGHSGQSTASNTRQDAAEDASQDAAADDARQDAGSDTRSTDSPDPSTTTHEQPPKTPSTTRSDTLYNSSALHATSGYATGTVNPLWSPGSNVESVSSPLTPQVIANQSSGWHAGTAELEDSEATTAEQSASGFEASQPTAHSVSASQDGGESLLNAVQHEPASSRLEHEADELDAGQPSARSNRTNTDVESPAEQQSEASSSDIYEAAQTRLNKDAAEAYFRKGQEAVQQRDWPNAGRLLTKACSLDQDIGQRLAGMLDKLDKKLVPRLKEHIASDLLKSHPGRDAKAAAAPGTTGRDAHGSSDADEATASKAAAASSQPSTSYAPSGDSDAESLSPHQGHDQSSRQDSEQQRRSGHGVAQGPKSTRNHAKESRPPSDVPGTSQQCWAESSASQGSQASHANDSSPGTSKNSFQRDPPHVEHHHEHASPSCMSSEQEEEEEGEQGWETCSDTDAPATEGTHWQQPWMRQQDWPDVFATELGAEAESRSSLYDIWVRFQIFSMSCYNSGAAKFRASAAWCWRLLASCTKMTLRCSKATAWFALALTYDLGKTAWTRLRPAIAPALPMIGSCIQPCVPMFWQLLQVCLLCLAGIMVLVLFAFELLQDYVLLLLWLAGRQDWRQKLLVGRKKGRWQARLISWVVSPLLAITTIWWFHANPWDLSAVSFLVFCATLPFQLLWQLACWASGYVTSAWVALPTCLISWVVVKNSNKATCCDVLLFWILGCRWTGGGAVLLRRCTVGGAVQHDTWTTHVAIWTGYQVWTTSYLADLTVFRIAIMAGIWFAWANNIDMWKLFKEVVGFIEQGAAPEPQAPSPSAGPDVPLSRPSGDPKEEVKRILAAKSHYAVLEVGSSATEDIIKRARRSKSLMVHPDKVGSNVAGAADAFGKVTLAAEVLSDPAQRRQYDYELGAAAESRTPRPGRAATENEAEVAYQDCDTCGLTHMLTRRPDIDHSKARWCREHHCFHAVKKGDGWVTPKHSGFMGIFSQEYTVYACLHPDGDIYEVTELATCQGMLNSTVFQQLGADCCKVWLTFNPQTSHRDRQKQRQQERHTERQARHQQQGTNDSAGRKKGRKGRKRR